MDMTKFPSYEEIASVLAKCAHDHLMDPEPVVDNMTTSALELVTGVLYCLQLLKPIDDIGRRWLFTCDPVEFEAVIRSNQSAACCGE